MTTPTLHDSEDGAKVKSLHKALGLLDYFTIDKTELGVTELAQKSGMLKSSVSNILSTFEQSGIVERNPATGKYHLGLKIMALNNLIYLNNDLRRVSRPVLERIADICQETVYLAKMYDMTQIIYLDSIFPRGNSGGKNLIGLRVPAVYYLANRFGPDYMYYGYGIGWILGFAMSAAYYFSGRWKRHGSMAEEKIPGKAE